MYVGMATVIYSITNSISIANSITNGNAIANGDANLPRDCVNGKNGMCENDNAEVEF